MSLMAFLGTFMLLLCVEINYHFKHLIILNAYFAGGREEVRLIVLDNKFDMYDIPTSTQHVIFGKLNRLPTTI